MINPRCVLADLYRAKFDWDRCISYGCNAVATQEYTRHAIGPTTSKHDVIHKTGSTLHIATPSKEDRVTATGNVRKKLAKFDDVVFEIDGQTDKQTRSSQYTAALLGSK